MEEHASRFSRMFSNSFAIELTGKIMVVIIIILFLVIVFVLILQLYARLLLSPSPSPSHFDESTTTASHSHRRSAGQDSAVVTLRKGLDPVVLRSLPVLIFEPQDYKDGLECAVCLSEVTQGERARLLPKCNHGFHVDCIDMWFQSNSTCPLCRNTVATKCSNPVDSTEDLESRRENLDSGSSTESPMFPTNILFWGNQMQVSSRGVGLEDGSTTSSSSAAAAVNARPDGNGMVTIDIPNEPSTSTSSSSSSSSSSSPAAGCSAEEEMKSVVTNRLRTLKRLLSRERRVSDNLNSTHVEQVGRGHS